MSRSMHAAAWLLLCSAPLAQSQSDVLPCVERQYDGTLHLATGILTPPDGSQPLGAVPGVIYNNTCGTAAFFGACNNGSTLLDDGRIPSNTSAVPYVGTKKSYRVTQFQIDYCTNELESSSGGLGVTVRVRFFADWDGCPLTLADAGTPVADFTLPGLPASTAAGTLTCHTVDVDLTGGFEFCLRADANGTYDGGGPIDGFGYALSMVDQLEAAGGFTQAGEPPCAPGAGTFYLPPEGVPGTGLENDIDWYREGAGGQTTGCFVSVPTFVGFHMVITADLDACGLCPDAGDPDADGDGAADCVDGCPDDPNKTSPGQCGCGIADTDTDADTIADCNDNCDAIANPGQEDCDNDQEGDACEIAGGAPDCNGNTVPDECDISSGTSEDQNGNGIPDECEGPGSPTCLPGAGGVIPCPCGNPPAGGGGGCDNFGTGPAQSGTLDASGTASLGADTVVLQATGENNTALTVFWTGKDPLSPTGLPHGAGVRCVTDTLKRLYTGSASGAAIARPGGSDPSVSARTAAVGSPILAGEQRHYFTIYRDPLAAGPCGNPSSTINLTNAYSIVWAP